MGGILVVFALSDDEEPSPTAINETKAATHARDACHHFEAFLDVVERNGSAERATDLLDAMSDEAIAAARLDPQWTQLGSGMQTLRLGFEEDDPDATRLGVRLVRDGCALADR